MDLAGTYVIACHITPHMCKIRNTVFTEESPKAIHDVAESEFRCST
jgi:hypothetical protein